MFSDRTLINRRNVKGNVSAAANACRRFFQLEVEARVVAASMKVLGMKSLGDKHPVNHPLPEAGQSVAERKHYLQNVALHVVDTFIVDKKMNEHLQQSALLLEQDKADSQGRFPCRFPGCPKSFVHNGKLRKEHESKHNPPVAAGAHHELPVEGDDDMLAYQKALLDYGILILNFFDAIAEADGDRVLRCWKFFLMYLKHQEGFSSKYALEALYLMFQVYGILSPQASHRLVWNRFIKNKPGIGCHIPLDLQLEFYNKFVKEAIKNLGPNATGKSMNRICHSLGLTTELMKTFDNNFGVFKRSGRHSKKSTTGDLNKIVKELVSQNAFTYTSGRSYRCYAGIKSSLLSGFDMRKMYTWINKHKKNMILGRHAR